MTLLSLVIFSVATSCGKRNNATGTSSSSSSGGTTNDTTLDLKTVVGSNPSSIALFGSYAFIGHSSGLIDIYSMTGNIPTTFISRVQREHRVDDVAITSDGKYLYVGGSSLSIYNVSDPNNPIHVYTDSTQSCLHMRLSVNNNLLSCSTGLYSLTNKESPTIVSSSITGNYDVRFSSDSQYLIRGFGNNLEIYDISTPSIPTLLSSTSMLSTPIGSVEISQDDNKAYVVSKIGASLAVLDISNKVTTGSKYDITTESLHNGNDLKISADGNTVYVADWGKGIFLYDVSNSSSITLISEYKGNGSTTDSSIFLLPLNSDNKLYSIARSSISVIDITTPTSPVHLKDIGASSELKDGFLSNDEKYLYIASSNRSYVGIQVYNIEYLDKSKFETGFIPTSTIHVGYGCYNINKDSNNRLIANCSEGVRIFDISTPPTLSLLGFRDYSGDIIYDMATSSDGSKTFIAQDNVGVIALNTTNPASILEYSTFGPTTVRALSLSPDENVLSVHTNTETTLYDVSNPASPALITGSNYSTGILSSVIAPSGNYIAGATSSSLITLDISNTGSPALVDSTSNASAKLISSSSDGKYLAFATNSSVKIYDWNTKTDGPTLLSTISRDSFTPGYSGTATIFKSIFNSDNTKLFILSNHGIFIVDITDKENPVFL